MKHNISNNKNEHKIEMKEIKYNSTLQKPMNSLMKKMMKDSSYFWKIVKLVIKITSRLCLKLKYNAR